MGSIPRYGEENAQRLGACAGSAFYRCVGLLLVVAAGSTPVSVDPRLYRILAVLCSNKIWPELKRKRNC